MAQIIAVWIFFSLSWQSLMQAFATRDYSHMPVAIVGAWVTAIIWRTILAIAINWIDDRFNNPPPLVTDMKPQAAIERCYSAFKGVYGNQVSDAFSVSMAPMPWWMNVVLIITPWEFLFKHFGESVDMNIQITENPEGPGSLVYATFQVALAPHSMRLFAPFIKFDARRQLKKILKARETTNQQHANTGTVHLAAAAYNAACQAYEDEQYEAALGHAKNAVAMRTEKSDYWAKLGDILCALGRYDEARDAYEHGAEIEPAEGWYQSSIAFTYYKQGDYERALAHIAQADRFKYWSKFNEDMRDKCLKARARG